MTKASGIFLALALLVAVPSIAATATPTVVELFTSEGCSSCPPADALLAELANRPEVLALSFHVDYWDRLGWKDPYSSPVATQRQRDYARLLGTGEVYTPQMVVDGHRQTVGSDRVAVEQAIAAARGTAGMVPTTLTLDHGMVQIAISAAASADTGSIVLIGLDRRHVDAVSGGENDGRTLTHVNVVRGIDEIGRFDGKPMTIKVPITWHADRLAILVAADNGRILGAAAADAAPR